MKLSTIIVFGSALAFAGVLLHQKGAETKPIDNSVYVFFTSKCSTAGIAEGCIRNPSEPQTFSTMQDCMAYADRRLGQIGDATVLGSCQRTQES